MKPLHTLVLICLILMAACKHATQSPVNKKDTELMELFGLMQGSFNSERQSVADSTYFNISLHMYPIWQERGNWLYVEQAMHNAQHRPYRQRIYEVKRNAAGQLASYIYTLPEDSLWVGQWKHPKAFDRLLPQDLGLRKGCEVILTKVANGTFAGQTGTGSCASNLRGASYATSVVRIDTNGLTSWDRGFNAAGEQVWGAVKGGYVFDALE
ncbi:chromophore lyase CpcT/CpeT [Maribacter sp. 2307ULW6-5]|uniref:chromophore lyase CpcT/CpeT n=1 Tax=Maribacter sp. 2307ULW6-5 TaxID=3386275 RepID=UPI0039BC8931